MKIYCEKNELVYGINTVSRAVPVRTAMPIMSCILINADENGIMLTANDMEIGIRIKVKGTVEEKGKAALNAKVLSEIVKKLSEGTVTVTSDSDNYEAVISCGRALYRINGMDAEQFPAFPEIDGDYHADIPQGTLKDMIRQTSFSIADTNANKMMTGELMEIHDGILSITSLDGHRISVRSCAMENEAENRKAIVPGKTMIELTKVMNGKPDDTVTVRFGKTISLFEFDGASVATRLIDGNYFNVNQMISSDFKTKITVSRKDLADAADRSLPLLSDGLRVPLIETIEDGKLSLKMNSGIGMLNDELPIEKEGEDLKIGFNPKYILDVLHSVEDDSVTMYFSGQKSPCIVRNGDISGTSEESAAATYVYVILPVNFIDS